MEKNVKIRMEDLDRTVWTDFGNGLKLKRSSDGAGIEVALRVGAAYPLFLTVETGEPVKAVEVPGFISAEAWKGRFLLSRAVIDLKDAASYLGSTEPGKPLSKEEYGRLSSLIDELEAKFKEMRSWKGEQADVGAKDGAGEGQ